MMWCVVFIMFYSISLFVASFSAFKLSPVMAQWIEQSMLRTNLGLKELAKISTDKALVVFSRYFWFAAVVCFLMFIVANKYFGHIAQQVTALLFFVFAYMALSIRAWNSRRFEILQNTLSETKKYSAFCFKWFFVLSLVLLLLVGVVNFTFDGEILKSVGSVLLVLGAGFFCLLVSVIIANTFSLFFIFAPAFIAIAYLWLSISLARVALFVGSRRLVNLFVLYMILGTIYLAIVAFPEFRERLGVPLICH